MLTYKYFCEANGSTVEISHGMNEVCSTWGEVCERGSFEVGVTPPSTSVVQIISGGFLAIKSRDRLGPPDVGCCSVSDDCVPSSRNCCSGSCCRHFG